MIRSTTSRVVSRLQQTHLLKQHQLLQRRNASFLEADSGKLATSVHHAMTTTLAVLTPIYFIWPAESDGDDGFFGKLFGLVLSTNIAAHSWVGLNYVATDYVPKVSKRLLGPARVVNVGIAAITFLGMTRIALFSHGGIRGCVKGLWKKPPKKEEA